MGLNPIPLKKNILILLQNKDLEALDKLEEELNAINKVAADNDFPQYINLRIQQERINCYLKEQIAIHEESIIQNPSPRRMLKCHN